MSKAQKQAVYRLRDKWDYSRKTSAGDGTSKEYANLKRQVSALSKKMNDFLTIEEPSGDEGGDKKKKAKLGGCNQIQP